MGLFSKKSSSRANSVTSETFHKGSRKGSQTSVVSIKSSMQRTSTQSSGSPQLPSIPSVDLPPAPDPGLDPSGYLRSVHAVRERSRFVIEAARKNQLTNFTVDMTKWSDVAEYVVSIIKVGLISRQRGKSNFSRETMPPITTLFLLTDDGSTLKWGVFHVLTI